MFDSEDFAKSFALAERGCDLELGVACYSVAVSWRHGIMGAPRKDLERADEHYKRACELGHAKGCTLLAATLAGRMEAEPAARDERNKLLDKACDLGDATACEQRAVAYKLEGLKDASRRSRWETTMRRSCDLGLVESCRTLAQYYQWGEFEEPDLPRAREMFTKTCEHSGRGKFKRSGRCIDIAIWWERGIGGPRDEEKALHYWRLDCQGLMIASDGYSETEMRRNASCRAAIVLAASAVPAPGAGTRAHWSSRCEAGERSACLEAGLAWLVDDGWTPDLQKARAFFIRACEATDGFVATTEVSCQHAGEMLITGEGGDRDVKQGMRYLARSCDACDGCRKYTRMGHNCSGCSPAPPSSCELVDKLEEKERACEAKRICEKKCKKRHKRARCDCDISDYLQPEDSDEFKDLKVDPRKPVRRSIEELKKDLWPLMRRIGPCVPQDDDEANEEAPGGGD